MPSIPVMAQSGLTPQSVNAFGGFKYKVKVKKLAQRIIEKQNMEEAGAFAVVLECIPEKLAKVVTKTLIFQQLVLVQVKIVMDKF